MQCHRSHDSWASCCFLLRYEVNSCRVRHVIRRAVKWQSELTSPSRDHRHRKHQRQYCRAVICNRDNYHYNHRYEMTSSSPLRLKCNYNVITVNTKISKFSVVIVTIIITITVFIATVFITALRSLQFDSIRLD